ncbi:hypothetical protein ElyMa_004766600 [Elysia marginata]|uniref:Ig-like domain-containing protein n=1 Tax=Elysia marginata TaxID=1093978 RepID=A0AAV4IG89_9GAST|nr:hypothetical protein ElyMa_004766600 [Elysia marginata]
MPSVTETYDAWQVPESMISVTRDTSAGFEIYEFSDDRNTPTAVIAGICRRSRTCMMMGPKGCQILWFSQALGEGFLQPVDVGNVTETSAPVPQDECGAWTFESHLALRMIPDDHIRTFTCVVRCQNRTEMSANTTLYLIFHSAGWAVGPRDVPFVVGFVLGSLGFLLVFMFLTWNKKTRTVLQGNPTLSWKERAKRVGNRVGFRRRKWEEKEFGMHRGKIWNRDTRAHAQSMNMMSAKQPSKITISVSADALSEAVSPIGSPSRVTMDYGYASNVQVRKSFETSGIWTKDETSEKWSEHKTSENGVNIRHKKWSEHATSEKWNEHKTSKKWSEHKTSENGVNI